jgi:hypothetical protein
VACLCTIAVKVQIPLSDIHDGYHYNRSLEFCQGLWEDSCGIVAKPTVEGEPVGVLTLLVDQVLPLGQGVEQAVGALDKVIAQLSAGYRVRQCLDESACG